MNYLLKCTKINIKWKFFVKGFYIFIIKFNFDDTNKLLLLVYLTLK